MISWTCAERRTYELQAFALQLSATSRCTSLPYLVARSNQSGGRCPPAPLPSPGGRRDGSRSRHPSMPNRVVASGSRQGFVRSHLAFGSPLTAPRTLQNRAESTIVDGRGVVPAPPPCHVPRPARAASTRCTKPEACASSARRQQSSPRRGTSEREDTGA